ncbi:PREDICTED: uncharacterized protein LOC105568013 [Vollenhovia emeryi]|uniref:uncharacterized protein LOC105568013 n=1 Tax=Vollenhovia emeryi TaxID=411798 RepID=UPI0005F44E00|nr:PREDICTED: uncharacterized protein LOC105568013 [Vollenhovia emeryi]
MAEQPRDLDKSTRTKQYITTSTTIPPLVHVPNDSLPEIRTSPSGLANPTAGHGAHGRNPRNYSRTVRSSGTSESCELQLPQLSTSLFLIRILIKFNTHGTRTIPTAHKEGDRATDAIGRENEVRTPSGRVTSLNVIQRHECDCLRDFML